MEPTQLDSVIVPEEQTTPEVSLNGTPSVPDTEVTLSPATGRVTPNLPSPVVDSRASKVKEALGQHTQKTTEEIRAEIANGREDYIRREAAARMTEQNYQQKMNMAIDLANSKKGPLSEDEFQRIMNPFDNAQVNPDTVVEKQYGIKYLDPLKNSDVPSPVKEAQEEIPEVANQAFLKGSELTARMEYAKRLKEEQQTLVKNQSVVGFVVDAAKQMFQPYNEAKMRGLDADVSRLAGIDLGSHLQETADKVFAIPDFEVFAKTSKSIVDGLAKDNPQLALRFSEYLEGLSTSDRVLDGAFTYMLPLDVASVGKLGLGVARRISLANRTNKAVRDYVEAAEKIGTDKAARHEAMGDLNTAAETKNTDLILRDVNGTGDPIKVATDDTLLTFLNQDRDILGTDKGNLSREQVTRIQDAYDSSGKSLLQRIVDAARINRIPMALATQNAVKIVRESIKDYYAGMKNAILDVSNPLYEAKSNTFWHEVTFGNYDGRLFTNPQTAENFAKINNLGDVKVIEGNGAITPQRMEKLYAAKAKVDSNIADWEQTVIRRMKEANDTSLPADGRKIAKDTADFIRGEIKKAQQKSLEIDLRLKGKGTYERAQQLDAELQQMRIVNKDLRKAMANEAREDVRAHMQASIDFGKAQIKAKLQESKALQEGTAHVLTANDTVEQHGMGFKIVVRRPLVETDKAVRDLMIRDPSGKLIQEATSTGSQTGFKALMNAALGKLRSADDTLALNDSINRKIATYTQSLFREWAQQEANYIKQIASGVIRQDEVTGAPIPYWRAKPTALWNKATGKVNSKFNDFTRTLEFARTDRDPETGKIGYFFRTPGELNNHYLKFYDRSPSFAEHQAYFAFVRMVEGDRILREIAEFRNRARLGAEQFSISARGPDGKAVKSAFFDGIAMKNFPGGDDVMMIMSKKLGEERIFNLGGAEIGPKKIAFYRDMVAQGRMKVIRIYAPEHTPLRDFSDIAGNEHVRYVLTDTVDSKPLEFNHVNRRGGGHFEYDYDQFLKQANMYHQYETGAKRYKSVYTGDTTFMPLLNRMMGNDIANKMHVIQKLILDGDLAEAKRFTQAHLPIEWDDLHAMFKPGRDDNGKVIPPKLSLHEPFVVVPKGKTVFDMDKALEQRHGLAFKDGSKAGSDNRQFSVAYNTERESQGLSHLEDIGTQGNPLYKYAPEGKMIDPITTMNRALNRIVNTVYMDDYKIFAVEHWLREAEKWLKADITEIHSSPFWHFQNANDKSAFKSGAPREVVNNLLSNRWKIQQFVGVPNSTDTAVHAASQWLVDAAYTSFGPETARSIGAKAVTMVPLWALNHIKDPVTIARSLTFHAKLGMFNPAQLLVQAQTFSAILSISPAHGVTGTYAAWLHGMGQFKQTPEMLKYLDNMATKLDLLGFSKWKPGQFTEAFETLKKTGFPNVAGEYSDLGTALKTDYIGNDLKGIANAGTWFFRQGEKSTRLGAWYTAFREFRELKPIGAITKDDIGKILQRADTLTINMSRASNSALNSGILSMTTQFLTYQMRMAELFMGNRISPMAKFRLATFYSLLYGAPSAIGLTGLPMSNAIREEATKRGYVPGENFIKTAVDVGLPAVMAAWIFHGKTDNQSLVNFGARYGSPGFTQLNDALKSDHTWYQLLGGASGTTLLNTLTSTSNFFKVAASMLSPNNKDKAFPLKVDDFVDLFKEVSTVNQTWKLIFALNTGKWLSKNEGYLGDVSKAGATFYALTGTQPQAVEDSYIKSNIRKEEVAFQKYALKEFIQEYRRYLQAARDNNPQQAKEYFVRANTMLIGAGYPADKMATAMSIAAKGYETQINDQDFSFAFKNVPQSRSDFLGIPTPFTTQSNIPNTRLEQFRTQERLKRQ